MRFLPAWQAFEREGEGKQGARTRAREEGDAFSFSLAGPNSPFPFPFQRRPRRLMRFQLSEVHGSLTAIMLRAVGEIAIRYILIQTVSLCR